MKLSGDRASPNRCFVATSREQVLHPYFVSRMLFTPGAKRQILLKSGTTLTDTATAAQRDRLNRSLSLDPVNRVSYLESRCYMLNTLLRDSDFMSMSQGLEVRVPLSAYLVEDS
jgi:asparagine synthase (glutamine-hydrolysing)